MSGRSREQDARRQERIDELYDRLELADEATRESFAALRRLADLDEEESDPTTILLSNGSAPIEVSS